VESPVMDERRRVLVLTPGNLRQSHLYIRSHYDFFPPDCVAPATKTAPTNSELEIFLDGLNETVKTDIARDGKSGKPRGFFRGRTWVRRFFEHHEVSAGDELLLERTADRRYRLTVGSQERQSWLIRSCQVLLRHRPCASCPGAASMEGPAVEATSVF
jgi:hypothetical protein